MALSTNIGESSRPRDREIASQHTSDDVTRSEDARFFGFAKSYLAMLSAVGALPLLASAVNVLPAPQVWLTDDSKVQFAILASFLSLLTFASCRLLAPTLGQWHKNGPNLVVKFIPFASASVLAIAGVALTSVYLGNQSGDLVSIKLTNFLLPNPQPDAEQAAQPAAMTTPIEGKATGGDNADKQNWVITFSQTLMYLLIYPLFVGSLGIILNTSYMIQGGQDLQSLVERRLSSKADTIIKQVRDYANYTELSEKDNAKPFREIGGELLRYCCDLLSELSRGRVVFRGQTTYLQELLIRNYHETIEAVSDRDLTFWLGNDDPRLAEDYIQLNNNAVLQGTKIMRIFLLSDEELKDQEGVVRMLMQQTRIGVEWGVACYGELGPEIRARSGVLDFMLLNTNACFGYYSGQDPAREYVAVFNLDSGETRENAAAIFGQRELHSQLLSRIWLATASFKQFYAAMLKNNREGANGYSTFERIKKQRESLCRRIPSFTSTECPEELTFPIEITAPFKSNELREAVKKLVDYRELSQDEIESTQYRAQGSMNRDIQQPGTVNSSVDPQNFSMHPTVPINGNNSDGKDNVDPEQS
ncbi:MAG: hypothetical protein H7144_11550 [Burkholderiales bacterium]|nr:hypothetical protein [Phycisphaerae bacterium]